MKNLVMFLMFLISALSTKQAQSQSVSSVRDTTATTKMFTNDSSYYVLYVLKSETQLEEILISNTIDITTLIDKDNIEFIEVLKYESATNAYGSRAAHGAVVIHYEKEFKKLPKGLDGRFVHEGN